MKPTRSRIWQPIVAVAFAGVITTVGIAWLSAAFASRQYMPDASGDVARGDIRIFLVRTDTPLLTWIEWKEPRDGARRPIDPPAWAAPQLAPHPTEPARPGRFISMETASGFPLRALAAEVGLDPQRPTTGWICHGGILLGKSHVTNGPPPRALPLRIIPLGFAVNTALAVALGWLMLFLVPTLQRLLRERRDACQKCGYGPLGTDGCPECGWNRSDRVHTAPAGATAAAKSS